MNRSRSLAGLVGPTLVVLAATEALNMDVYEHQTPNVVYLNGTILFVAGLAMVRAHNRWLMGWPVFVTLAGWIGLLAGLYRMVWPHAPQADASPATFGMLAVLGTAGLVLTVAGYAPRRHETEDDAAPSQRTEEPTAGPARMA